MANTHPAPEGATVYYWSDGLLMLARTLVVEKASSPLTATLRIACAEPYLIEVDGQPVRTRASLLGPKSGRRRIEAVNSELAVFYLPLDAPEFSALKKKLGGEPLLQFDIERFEPLLPEIRAAAHGDFDSTRLHQLVHATVQAITGEPPVSRPRDPRIVKALQLLEDLPLDQVSLDGLSTELHLSPSRLRELFKQETGSTIGDTARWFSLWRVLRAWQQGEAFTDYVERAGFYDLAHFNHAFVEAFGLNPLSATDSRFVKLVRC